MSEGEIGGEFMVYEADLDETGNEDEQYNRNRLAGSVAKRASIAETRFLSLLRYSALFTAALVLLGSLVFLGIGSFKQVGPTKVDAESVSITADEVTPPKVSAPTKVKPVTVKKLGISQNIRQQTLATFKTQFKSYQRADAKITEQQVVDFVWSEDRIEQFDNLAGLLVSRDGEVLADRESVMQDAIRTVKTANQTENFKSQLTAYRNAKKTNVCTEQTRTRSRTVDSWDSSASYCEEWYLSPIGCASKRTINEPYTEKVCSMKFPDNLEAPEQQFANAVQRYADGAVTKLEGAQNDAEAKTADNNARKAQGWLDILTSGKMFLGFLFVMFLYLFVAVERHHRMLADEFKNAKSSKVV